MIRKVILFFSCEPGGAEVLIPVIKLVAKETSHQVIVLGYGLGAERFARKGVEYIEVSRVVENDPTIMNTYRPDLIITSATSLPNFDMSEKYLWHNARLAGVPTIAFLDQWQNYTIRFSGPSTAERMTYLPDYINCINTIAEREMIAEGFDPRILIKFGQPYLSSLRDDAKLINTHEIIKGLGILSNQRVILFASEAIREHYGRSRGYDQYDALRLFLDLMTISAMGARLLIKLHPKDTVTEYERILAEYDGLSPLIVTNNLTSVECIKIAAEVYGMTSIMLIEAFVLGKKVVSLQPGLQVEDAMILSRLGLIQKITDKSCNFSGSAKGLMVETSPRMKLEITFKAQEFVTFLEVMFKRSGSKPKDYDVCTD
jgi:hypothetical protein